MPRKFIVNEIPFLFVTPKKNIVKEGFQPFAFEQFFPLLLVFKNYSFDLLNADCRAAISPAVHIGEDTWFTLPTTISVESNFLNIIFQKGYTTTVTGIVTLPPVSFPIIVKFVVVVVPTPVFGINLKFTDIQAVIGIEQMKKLSYRVKRIREIYELYYKNLKGICEIKEPLDDEWIPWFVDIYCEIIL